MALPPVSVVSEALSLLSAAAGRPLPDPTTRLVIYRLLRVELGRQRGHELDPHHEVGRLLPGVPADGVITALRRLHCDDAPGAGDARALGELHQALLSADQRRGAGSYFTPDWLIEHLLDLTLEPAILELGADAVTVCDPSCGSGLFLVAAARRLLGRGVAAAEVLARSYGIDLDPGAVELTRTSLWLTAVDAGAEGDLPEPPVVLGDALAQVPPGAPYDVVVGNPPFLNRLERLTAVDPEVGRRLTRRSGGAVRAYTDLSAVFLHQAISWTRPGGRVGLVQPQSLLAARDAAGVRAAVAASASLESLWASDRPVFDAGVLTCAPVLQVGGAQGPVRRWHGVGADPLPDAAPGDLQGTWSHLLAGALGVPEVQLDVASHPGEPSTIGDVADCTADFRDQYYGLRAHVREAATCPDGAPLVTSGLIDPALCSWGTRTTRFLKQAWRAPVVDLRSAADDEAVQRWVLARRVPKILLATQGRVVEAVADESGEWLPSVPVITVVPRGVSAWLLMAVLLAPPVAVHAATTFAGAGLSMRAIKLSAAQVGQLPLPRDVAAWEQGALLAQRAQASTGTADRIELLLEMGRRMCAAYDVDPRSVMPWWGERLR